MQVPDSGLPCPHEQLVCVTPWGHSGSLWRKNTIFQPRYHHFGMEISCHCEKQRIKYTKLPRPGRFIREKVNCSILFWVGTWDLFYCRNKFDRLYTRPCGWGWESGNHLDTVYMSRLLHGSQLSYKWAFTISLFISWDFLYATNLWLGHLIMVYVLVKN